MKRTTITIGTFLSIICIVLISYNPVIGVQAVEKELQEEIQYITIPSEYYPILKTFIIKMGVDEIVIEDLDFYSYEGEDGLEYIPIICELVQIFIHLSSFFSLICFIPFLLTYMLSYGMLDLLSLIFVTGVFFFFELRDKLYELEKIVC